MTLDGAPALFTSVAWKANVVVLTDASGGVYVWSSKVGEAKGESACVSE